MQQPFNLEAWVDSHPWYREYLERLPRHPEGRWRPFYNVRCSSWSAGRVAIVGDAAHSMSPNLGQGACVAICNAVVLARVVTESDDVARGLRMWEASERPYIDITQRNSNLYGAIGTRWPRALLDVRTAVLPFITRFPPKQRSMRAAVDHVPDI